MLFECFQLCLLLWNTCFYFSVVPFIDARLPWIQLKPTHKNLENLCSFLLRAPKKFRQNDSHYLFQAFLDECEQACRGVHDNEFCTWQSGDLPLIFWLVICKSLTSQLLFCWNSGISLLWLRSMKTLFWLSAVGVSSSLQ